MLRTLSSAARRHISPLLRVETRCFSPSSRILEEATNFQTREQEIPRSSVPLGNPLPFDEHACSVSLPTWSSVVGYEEGEASVTDAMNVGYPRFVYHPYVLQLMEYFLDTYGEDNEDCIFLPTKEAALRCQTFLQQSAGSYSGTEDIAKLGRPESPKAGRPFVSRIVSFEEAGVHAVVFPAITEYGMAAKAYWQHTGELVSSRRASQALQLMGQSFTKRVTSEGNPAILHSCAPETPHGSVTPYRELQARIAGWTNVPEENVFLLPSGMSTMYKALRSARRYQLEKSPTSRGGTSIVFGFPYLDTLKLCSRGEFSPGGVEFFGKGDERDLTNLRRQLETRQSHRWSAIFTEVPSNPLLQCPDLDHLRAMADAHDTCLVVDDTIGNFLNVDLIESGLADAVCTSLTKLVSGRGDAIGGSLVLNPNTKMGRWMRDDMAKDTDTDSGLYEADARAIVYNSRDFVERNERINDTGERLADYLNDHPDVEIVWYPKFVAPTYSKYQKGGFGGLMSIHLDSHICQRTFYDVLDVAKGPSLGTNFTLVCPYTLLAHYHELDFALNYNVPPNLIRISVGLEDFEELKEKFEAALSKSRLHPKLSAPPSFR